MLAQPTRRATSHRALMERRTHSLEGEEFLGAQKGAVLARPTGDLSQSSGERSTHCTE